MAVATAPRGRKGHLSFSDRNRDAHVQALLDWLPADLLDLPGIEWARMPSESIGYLVRTVRDSPDRAHIAVAAGVLAWGLQGQRTHYVAVQDLHRLFSCLRTQCGLMHIADLSDPDKGVWSIFAQKTAVTASRLHMLGAYASLTDHHFPLCLEALCDEVEKARLRRYDLPPLPRGFIRRYGGKEELRAAAEMRRKAQSDIIVPLHTVLIALLLRRKNAARRLSEKIRAERARVENGEVTLPHHFTHDDTIPVIQDRTVTRVAEIKLYGRPVTMHLTLWDKRSWTLHHQERYSQATIYSAKGRYEEGPYAADKEMVFVEYTGAADDLLWFGSVVGHGLLQVFNLAPGSPEQYRARARLAHELSGSDGFATTRPGLLHSGDGWLSYQWHPDEYIFEPDALYRGVLYGTTLALIALTGSARVNELLQMSLERRCERPITYTKTTDEGKKLLIHDTLYYQRLLPKGSMSEHERKFFPIYKPAVLLLHEIIQGLKAAHGGTVPTISPTSTHSKKQHLAEERYYFQWAACADDGSGMLTADDVTVLLRFVLHGLDLRTRDGDPILLTVHVLRHASSTAARRDAQAREDTATFELAISNLMLHHKQPSRDTGPYIMPEASQMYTRASLDEQLDIVADWFNTVEEDAKGVMVLEPPTPKDLAHLTEGMRERLQATYDKFGFLLPVTFGRCGNENACPRGLKASLCLGCEWLQVDPAKRPEALVWRKVFTMQAELLDAQGNDKEARAMRLQLLELDDIIGGMAHLQEAAVDGGYERIFQGFAALPDGTHAMEA